MNENTLEKSLIKTNDKENLFQKIKKIFMLVFKKKEIVEKVESQMPQVNKKNDFRENIKNIYSEENDLLELQRLYELDEIKEKDMTKEQVDKLCKLYDRQIDALRKSNNERKKRIQAYKLSN